MKTPASPADLFRKQISAAVAAGGAVDDMTLRLTLTDADKLRRDRALPVEEISFADGVMRFLGVRVEAGGVAQSSLDAGG